MATGPELLFVYGTLRLGQGPEGLREWLADLPRTAPAWVSGSLIDLGDYPGALLEGDGVIVGELVALPADRLPVLDRYEGFDPDRPEGSLFVREVTEARLADGEPRTCWIYRYAQATAGRRVVPGGDWLAWRRA